MAPTGLRRSCYAEAVLLPMAPGLARLVRGHPDKRSDVSDFSKIAGHYRETSTIQRSASGRVFDLLAIGPHDDVLDLGCGTGHLAQAIAEMTDGAVAGLDPSPEMIEEARREPGDARVTFSLGSAETLAERDRYDAIFCNSAMQWFRDPPAAVSNCLRALRPGGRMAVQAPARADYCPNFVEAVEGMRADDATRDRFAGFTVPWFFLESAQEYAAVFEDAGFEVTSADIETIVQRCTPAKAMEIFESGAAAGYFDPAYYESAPDGGFFEHARRVVAQGLRAQADDSGELDLTFNRIYMLAVRPSR